MFLRSVRLQFLLASGLLQELLDLAQFLLERPFVVFLWIVNTAGALTQSKHAAGGKIHGSNTALCEARHALSIVAIIVVIISAIGVFLQRPRVLVALLSEFLELLPIHVLLTFEKIFHLLQLFP